MDGETVGGLLASAVARFGPQLGEVIATSTIWVNGERAELGQLVRPSDEVAVLPPVSGG